MKKKLLLPLILLLALITACSPEIVNTIPSQEIKADSSSVDVIKEGNKVVAQFQLVPYANSYAYKIDGGELTLINSYDYLGNNRYSFELSSDLISGDITIYANTKADNTENWIPIAHSDFALSLAGVELDAYVARRGADFVEIGINSTLNPDLVFYLVNGEFVEQIGKHLIRVPLDSVDATSITIVQGLINDPEESQRSNEAKVEVYAYNEATYSEMVLSIDNEYLTVTNIDKALEEITFGNVKAVEDYESIKKVPITNGEAKLALSELPGLYAGYFCAYDESSGRVSNYVKYTTPIKVKSSTANWQSVELEVDLDKEISTLDFVVTGGTSKTAAKLEGNKIIISGLDSNTHYPNLVIKAKGYPNEAAYWCEVQTKSFVGTYEWKGTLSSTKETNFKIVVKEAPKESDLSVGYNAFFHDEDDAIKGSTNVGKALRIMPLVDPKIDNVPMLTKDNKVVIATPGDYSKQNDGYLVNSKKWNRLKLTPKSWTIQTFENSHDFARTVTLSGISKTGAPTMDTTTAFSFEEKVIDGQLCPVVMFENSSKDAMVNSGLHNNSAPKKELGENTYIFCLQRVNK